jgi:diketogulonate reductase-like aldo/keto reductase
MRNASRTEGVGQRKNATPGQAALAWLLARRRWIVPIPGTTGLNHLEENLDAVRVELTPDDVKAIEAGFAAVRVQGARATQELLDRHDAGAISERLRWAGRASPLLPRTSTQ